MRSGLEVYGPRTAARVGARRRRGARRRARRTGARCSRSRRSPPGVALRHGVPGVRAAVRAGRRLARAEPARSAAAAAGRAGARVRRPAVLAAAPRRRGARRWSPRSSAGYDGPFNVVGPGAATPWQAVRLGGRVPLPVRRAVLGRGARAWPSSRARRSRRTSIELLRHGRTGDGRPRGRARSASTHLRADADRCCASSSSGPTSIPIPTEPRGGGVTRPRACTIADATRLDVDRDRPRVAPFGDALRRRLDGRYPVDPFGLDPQLVDLVAPVVHAPSSASTSTGGEHVPDAPGRRCSSRTAASASSSRPCSASRCGARPAAGCASSARPTLPFVGGLARRLGAISAQRARPVAACCAPAISSRVPLAPTWLRTGAGIPPRPLLQAMTRAPIDPGRGDARRAVRHRDRARGGCASARWSRSTDPYDPGDPLAAAALRRGGARRGRASSCVEP